MLIQEQSLFESGANISTTGKTMRENKENSELGNKKDNYVHCELLYEPGFKSFPTLKL